MCFHFRVKALIVNKKLSLSLRLKCSRDTRQGNGYLQDSVISTTGGRDEVVMGTLSFKAGKTSQGKFISEVGAGQFQV